MDHDTIGPTFRRGRLRSSVQLALLLFLAVGGGLLIFEHRVHLLGAWPLLFLVVCFGSHMLMHRGHGRGGHNGH